MTGPFSAVPLTASLSLVRSPSGRLRAPVRSGVHRWRRMVDRIRVWPETWRERPPRAFDGHVISPVEGIQVVASVGLRARWVIASVVLGIVRVGPRVEKTGEVRFFDVYVVDEQRRRVPTLRIARLDVMMVRIDIRMVR